jgi:hypothetical protein
MPSTRVLGSLLVLLAASASGQNFSTSYPGTFVDLSMTAANSFTPSDDSTHGFTTTIGNSFFGAGACTIGNNGVLSAASGATGPITNADILPAALPTGLTASANGIICAFWDDLYPNASHPTRLYWQEAGGVLYVEWYRENHFSSTVVGEDITVEVQIFASPAPNTPSIQIFYQDAVFGGLQSVNDNGLSATIGWVKAANANPLYQNTKWSFNTAAVASGTVLSLFAPMQLAFTSPFGPGSIQVDIDNGPSSGTYFLCATLNAGNFPNGYFFGIVPSLQEVLNEANGGWPFLAGLDALGHATIGPITGVPNGLTVYAVALGFDSPALDYPHQRSAPKTYTVP